MSVEKQLRKASKLAAAGDRAGAAALYQNILARFPANKQARKGLQSLSVAAGPAPSPAQIQTLTQQFMRGDYASVLTEGQRLLMLFPKAPALLNLVAMAHSRTGRLDQALAGFDRLIEIDPAFSAAYTNKASALARLGRYQEVEAACRTALALDPKLVQAHLFLGYALLNTGRASAGEAAFREAIRLAPDLPQPRIGLGNALSAQSKHADALEAFEAARANKPDDPDIANNIGNALVALDRIDEAIALLDETTRAHPRHSVLRTNYARALRDYGRVKDAITECQAALELDPDSADAWGLLGSCYREMGDSAKSAEALNRAVAIDPANHEALAFRWQLEKLPLDHPDYARITALVEAPDTRAADRALLEFTLFSAHHKAGDPDTAFLHLERANRLRRTSEPYDIEQHRRMFEALKGAFEKPVAPLDGADLTDIPAPHRPVFIVGMPRSGTTLVEQILASHSQVYGGGELTTLGSAMAHLYWSAENPGRPPEPEALRTLRRDYFAGIARLDTDRPVVTDKTPLNFRWLGYALTAMPEARVLFMRRDARATCWSNYSNTFIGRANNFGHDMVDTAEMYLMHLDMMEFWKARFPDRITVVPYERLTEHQEEESRKLVAAAGLDWEDACLDFHKTSRAVRTVSAPQVRKKMYKGSSEAWRAYEAHLGPMLERLKDV